MCRQQQGQQGTADGRRHRQQAEQDFELDYQYQVAQQHCQAHGHQQVTEGLLHVAAVSGDARTYSGGQADADFHLSHY